MIPAVVLPPEQAQTMFNAVLDVYEEQKRLPWLPPG
jgi:ribosome-associated toxin RatA of RatAB toxin-antitoxin module